MEPTIHAVCHQRLKCRHDACVAFKRKRRLEAIEPDYKHTLGGWHYGPIGRRPARRSRHELGPSRRTPDLRSCKLLAVNHVGSGGELPVVEGAVTQSSPLRVHTLVSHRRLSHYVRAIRSLARYCDYVRPLALDDGTLTAADVKALTATLPSVMVVKRAVADEIVRDSLRGHDAVWRLRTKNVRIRQLVDYPVFAGDRRFLGMDSDVLFLGRPGRIFSWLASGERISLYSPERAPIGPTWAREFHPDAPLAADACCGFVCIDPATFFDLEYLDYLVARTPPAVIERAYGPTTMFYALLLGRAGARSLGAPYASGPPHKGPALEVIHHYPASSRLHR